MPAEETFSAKGLNIDCNPVTAPDLMYIAASLLYYPDHFMTYRYTGNGTWDTSVLYVQVTGTDARQRHFNDGIIRTFQDRFPFPDQTEMVFSHIRVCKHIFCKYDRIITNIS